LAVVELKKNMTEIKPKTVKVLTPSDNTFREGAEVFYRNGLYYFLWSENDTRDEDYRVRYGTSTSPTGPIEIPENNLILSKRPEKGIYGTGHNSVIQVPGKDEWFIVYHRFNRPNGIKMGSDAGFHREVAIDKMEFNSDGSIKVVEPTI
jgi:arabinoxylan arabinofuranohydrolase